MDFDIVSEITGVETIAVGTKIRDIKRLRKQYGKGRAGNSRASQESASAAGASD
jgi:hypothetical protein